MVENMPSVCVGDSTVERGRDCCIIPAIPYFQTLERILEVGVLIT